MRKCIVSMLALCCCTMSYAASVTFKKIWLEHNVMLNGEKGMKVHVAFDISGMKGQQCEAIAYFDYPKGTGIKDTNDRYCTKGGTVCTSTNFTPGWPNATYSDLSMFIPNSELHLLPGKHTYYTRVFIQTPNGNFIGNSDFASFEGTGYDNSNQNNYANRERANSGVAINGQLSNVCIYFKNANGTLGFKFDGKWMRHQNLTGYYDEYVVHGTTGSTFFFTFAEPKNEGNYWVFSDNIVSSLKLYMRKDYQYAIIAMGSNKIEFTQRTDQDTYKRLQDFFYRVDSGSGYSNGISSNPNNTSSGNSSSGSSSGSSSRYTKCTSCNGTGVCSSCGGRKGSWNDTGYYTGNDVKTWINCGSCGGSGRCPICHGRGRL